MNGGMHKTGAFCEFYEEQVRYAFRLIADEKADDYPLGRLGQGHAANIRHGLKAPCTIIHITINMEGSIV